VTALGAECRLLNVVHMHADLVVARAEVQLGEEACAVEFVEQLIDDRDRELVLYCAAIESSVVDAEAPGAVVFLDEENGRRKQTC
jgi:hypothetical protein